MRFHLDGARRHRLASKALARELRAVGRPIGHTAALDLAARLYGYADRHELDACLGRAEPSRWDEDEAPGVVADRRERQIAVLAAAGLDAGAATRVLDAVRPTARKPAPSPRPAGPARAEAEAAPPPLDDVLSGVEAAISDRGRGSFEEAVRIAYERDCRTASFSFHGDRKTEGDFAVDLSMGAQQWDKAFPDRAAQDLHLWLERCPPGIDVPHPDGPIPVEIERERSYVNGLMSRTFKLGRTFTAAPPEPSERSIPGWERWERAIRVKPGVHVVSAPWSDRRFDEGIAAYLDASGLPAARTASQHVAFSGAYPSLREQPTYRRPKGKARSALVATLGRPDRRMAVGIDVSLSRGQALIVFTPVPVSEWLRTLLMAGYDGESLRRDLAATATFHCAEDPAHGSRPGWTVAVRDAAPAPPARAA